MIDTPTTAEPWRLGHRAARGVHLGLRAHACGGLDFERRQASVAVSYDEDRASSEAQDPFGDAAEQQATDRAPAVRADHNQVRLLFLGVLDDGVRRRSRRGRRS